MDPGEEGAVQAAGNNKRGQPAARNVRGAGGRGRGRGRGGIGQRGAGIKPDLPPTVEECIAAAAQSDERLNPSQSAGQDVIQHKQQQQMNTAGSTNDVNESKKK